MHERGVVGVLVAGLLLASCGGEEGGGAPPPIATPPVPAAPSVTLPSAARASPVPEAVLLAIGPAQVALDDRPVGTVAAGRIADPSGLAAALRSLADRQRLIAQHNPSAPFRGDIRVAADAGAPWPLVRQALRLADEAGLGTFYLSVQSAGGPTAALTLWGASSHGGDLPPAALIQTIRVRPDGIAIQRPDGRWIGPGCAGESADPVAAVSGGPAGVTPGAASACVGGNLGESAPMLSADDTVSYQAVIRAVEAIPADHLPAVTL